MLVADRIPRLICAHYYPNPPSHERKIYQMELETIEKWYLFYY